MEIGPTFYPIMKCDKGRYCTDDCGALICNFGVECMFRQTLPLLDILVNVVKTGLLCDFLTGQKSVNMDSNVYDAYRNSGDVVQILNKQLHDILVRYRPLLNNHSYIGADLVLEENKSLKGELRFCMRQYNESLQYLVEHQEAKVLAETRMTQNKEKLQTFMTEYQTESKIVTGHISELRKDVAEKDQQLSLMAKKLRESESSNEVLKQLVDKQLSEILRLRQQLVDAAMLCVNDNKTC